VAETMPSVKNIVSEGFCCIKRVLKKEEGDWAFGNR
jgi:hypothetical protein